MNYKITATSECDYCGDSLPLQLLAIKDRRLICETCYINRAFIKKLIASNYLESYDPPKGGYIQ